MNKLMEWKFSEKWYAKRLSAKEIENLDTIAKNYWEEHSWRNSNDHIEDEWGNWYVLLSNIHAHDGKTIRHDWVILEISGKKVIWHVWLYHAEIRHTQSKTQAILSA